MLNAASGSVGSSQAVVVLGAAIRWEIAEDGARCLCGAVSRRVLEGARAYRGLARAQPGVLVVASGGRSWSGDVEADAIRDGLVRAGVPHEAIARELCSMSTRDNARFTAQLLARRGVHRVVVVTCDWHLARAVALFAGAGLDATGAPARTEPASAVVRAQRWVHESVAARLDGLEAGWRRGPWADR